MKSRRLQIALAVCGIALVFALGLTACTAEGGGYGPTSIIMSLPGNTVAEQLDNLVSNGKHYTVTMGGSENIGARTLSGNYTVEFSGSGTLSGNITVGSGITLDGRVTVDGGTFRLTGGTINGNNTGSDGGGVSVASGGSFVMNSGTISGNTTIGNGGGVYVAPGGSFVMTGGAITNNTADDGGGVYVASGGSFDSTGGSITGNNATGTGGEDDIQDLNN